MGPLCTLPVSTNFLHGPGPHGQGGASPCTGPGGRTAACGGLGQDRDAGHRGPSIRLRGLGHPRASRPGPCPSRRLGGAAVPSLTWMQTSGTVFPRSGPVPPPCPCGLRPLAGSRACSENLGTMWRLSCQAGSTCPHEFWGWGWTRRSSGEPGQVVEEGHAVPRGPLALAEASATLALTAGPPSPSHPEIRHLCCQGHSCREGPGQHGSCCK